MTATDTGGPEARAEALAVAARERWRPAVLPLLETYARIPALSPAYDPAWTATGHLDGAARLLADWASARPLPGARVDVVRIGGLTPTVVAEVPATEGGASGTVLLYGHYDKQPPFSGWREGLGPWSPVVEGDRLYARGVADDGYALPTALVALEAVAAAGGRHARCVAVIEGSEESGSPHLPAVLDDLAERIGPPDLVVALDSGAATYDRLWATTSLRGAIVGTLTVSVLEHGVHSGSAGGIVPNPVRLLRVLLDRIEDPRTGEPCLPELVVEPPAWAVADARAMDTALAESGEPGPTFPTVGTVALGGTTPGARSLRAAWGASLAVVGADGLPPTAGAGAVLLPSVAVKLVLRVPPTVDVAAASEGVARALTSEPPDGARVSWVVDDVAQGWASGPPDGWLADALDRSSRAGFGRPAGRMGEGGTIPFMAWLAARYPAAQLVATGVLGPGANAHGPDESLHLPTAERVAAALAVLLDAHARRDPD